MGNKNGAVKAHKLNVIKFMCTVVGGQKEDKHLLHPIIFFRLFLVTFPFLV